MTNIKEIAAKINGREYRKEMTQEIISELKELGLIAVFGASDDLCEFRGAFEDELGAWDGATFLWNGSLFINNNDDEAANLSKRDCFYIEQTWCPDKEKSWGFKTNIPGAEKFEIKEEEQIYGEGLVIPFQSLLTMSPKLLANNKK